MELLEQALLCLAIEVNEHVAATDQVMRTRWGRFGKEITPLEAHESAHLGDDRERWVWREVSASQVVRCIGEVSFRERTALRCGQAPDVDVAPEYTNASRQLVENTESFCMPMEQGGGGFLSLRELL